MKNERVTMLAVMSTVCLYIFRYHSTIFNPNYWQQQAQQYAAMHQQPPPPPFQPHNVDNLFITEKMDIRTEEFKTFKVEIVM